jgi:WD40 repeat protein
MPVLKKAFTLKVGDLAKDPKALFGITCLRFSPDGKTLAAGVDGGSVVFWNLTTKKVKSIVKLRKEDAYPVSLTFSPDGNLAGVWGNSDGFIFCEVASGKVKFSKKAFRFPSKESLSEEKDARRLKKEIRKLIASLNDPYAPERYRAARKLGLIGPGAAQAVPALTKALKDKRLMVRAAAARALGRIGLGSKQVKTALTAALRDRARSVRDESKAALKRIAAAAKRERNIAKQKDRRTPNPGPVTPVAMSPDGNKLAWWDKRDRIKIWDVGARKTIRSLKVAGGESGALAFSPDGKALATWQGEIIQIWDVTSGKVKVKLKRHKLIYWGRLTFSANGKGLVSESSGALVLWDLPTAKAKRKKTRNWHLLRVSADAKTLAVYSILITYLGSLIDEVEVWDVPGKKAKLHLDFRNEKQGTVAAALSRDMRTLAVGGSGFVNLREVAGGKVKALSTEGLGLAGLFAFRADGKRLASVGIFDKAVKVWEVPAGLPRSKGSPSKRKK